MSTTQMVPMLAPDGTAGQIPMERVNEAVQAGGKLGVRIIAPDGTKGTVPVDRAHDAIKAGGKLMGADPGLPQLGTPPEAQIAQNEHETSDRAGHAFGFAAGGGTQAVEEEAAGAVPLAKKLAQKVMGHLKDYLGLGEEAAEAAKPVAEAAEAPKLPKVPKKVVNQSKALGPNAEVMQKSQALREVPTPATAPEPTAPVAAEPAPAAAPEPTAQPTAEPAVEAKPEPTPEPKPELPRRRLRALGSPEVDSRVLGDAAESAKKGETADEFVDRLTDGAYKVHDNGKIVEVKPPADEPLTEARQKAVGKQMEGKYEPKEYKRGPYKGKPKMARVFSDGAWHDVPQYGETQAAKAP